MAETREITLRNKTKGFRSLCLVADENVDLDPGEVVTVRMTEVEYRDALATEWFEVVDDDDLDDDDSDDPDEDDDPEDDDPDEDDADETSIGDVLEQLDPANDDHWTEAGLPAMAVVEKLLGRNVSRADVEAAAPGFKRPE